MSSLESLLSRLDLADPTDWEVEYARTPIDISRDEAREVVASRRRYALWFAFRFDAGPPGTPLPPLEDALTRVMMSREGTPLDAYALVFLDASESPIADDLVVPFLINCSASALRGGTTFFATWLAARAGLAAIALGAPDQAWRLLDLLTIEGRRHPNLNLLATFEPLRGDEASLQDPWVRAAICHRWPQLGVPLVPTLPFPPVPAQRVNSSSTLDRLDVLSAAGVKSWVESYLHDLNESLFEQYSEHPITAELRARALKQDLTAPDIQEIPSWFPRWAIAAKQQGDHHLARLAGLTLWRADKQHTSLSAALAVHAARSSDLELLREGLPDELGPLVDELKEVRDILPTEVCDALIAYAVPDHVHGLTSLDILARRPELLSAFASRPGGLISHAREATRAMMDKGSRQFAEDARQIAELTRQIEQVAKRLTTSGLLLDEGTLERAAASVRIGTLDPSLISEAFEIASERKGLERLLFALVLLENLNDTDPASSWSQPLAHLAAMAMDQRLMVLMPRLQLRLLDKALSQPPRAPFARLLARRAEVRILLGDADSAQERLALQDLEAARRQARAESNPILVAELTAMLVRTAIRLIPQQGLDPAETLPTVERTIADSLELPIDAFARATLLQARAHWHRATVSPAAAIADLEEALGLVTVDAPYWFELAADLVQSLARDNRLEKAVVQATAFLNTSSPADAPIERAMLYLASADALISSARQAEAKPLLETCLRLTRGTASHLEAQAHLQLARLALLGPEPADAEEHLRFLRDHRKELDPTAKADLDHLEAVAASTRGNVDETRRALLVSITSAPNELTRLGRRLELARLDLSRGRHIDDLDTLLQRAVQSRLEPHFEAILLDLICNYDVPFSVAALRAALDWANSRQWPSVAARLHALSGSARNAEVTLREALAGELGADERLRCIHQLLLLLDPTSQDYSGWCEELEKLLGDRDLATVRLDLAAAIHQSDRGDRAALERSRLHVRRAFESEVSDRAKEYGHRTLARITVDSLRLAQPLSSPDVAKEASWLLESLPLPPHELSELRCHAATMLLVPGPLVHPDALAIAAQLLDLAVAHPDPLALRALGHRLRWVRGLVTGPPFAEAKPESMTPLDDLAPDLIALVQGRSPENLTQQLERIVPLLVLAVGARPDAADRVLASLVPLQHKLKRELRRDLLDAIYSAVQSAAEVGQFTWPLLREAVAGVRKQHQHPMLENILSATKRAAPKGANPPRRTRLRDTEGRRAGTALNDRERALECFERGVALMESLQVEPFAEDAAERMTASRELLDVAVAIAQQKKLPELFDYLVSCGNAWKARPNEDLARALGVYETATKLQATPNQRAKLWKVQADALLMRGDPGDIRLADTLLERSCRNRRGRFLAEALLSRAHVALVHPGLDTLAREQRAAAFAMDAIRTDPAFGSQDAMIHFVLGRLSAWSSLKPDDPTPRRLRDELKALYPARAKQIDAPASHITPREIDCIVTMMTHPSGQAYWAVRSRLMSPSEIDRARHAFDHLGPSAMSAIQTHTLETSLHGRPEEAEALLAALAAPVDDASRPGHLTARALLTAHLARLGRRPISDVTRTTQEALASLDDVDDKLLRSTLLRELATLWSPNNHVDDPVRDFGLAVDLLWRCVELEGGEELALRDTLGFLARALRYTSTGDREHNLSEAQRLYELVLERARLSGGPDLIANALANLAELETQDGRGTRRERHLAAVRRLEEAVGLAKSPHLRAQLTASLAWEQTQLALLIPPSDTKLLEEALSHFDRVDMTALEDHARLQTRLNRQVCVAALARSTGGPSAEATSWREFFAQLGPNCPPYPLATAKHNLATALLASGDLDREVRAECLHLLLESAEHRTLEANPRHCWETALAIGLALLEPLMNAPALLPFSPAKAHAFALDWLLRAAAAARALGPGEELFRTALALSELATVAPTHEGHIAQSEGAWAIIREASAYLLLAPKLREEEAWAALRTAGSLAFRLAEHAGPRPGSVPGIAFVLDADSAELIANWIVRSQNAARRPLRARLSRPDSIPISLWETWQTTLVSRAPSKLADTLDKIRKLAPTFLAEDHPNDITWRWLEARPGSVAITLLQAHPHSLALVMRTTERGHETTLLGLDLPPSPHALDALPAAMRSPNKIAKDTHDGLAEWLQTHAISPILQYLGSTPSAVLWNPGPTLRLIAPSALWRDVPVAVTTSLLLPELDAAPGRRLSSLLVLADPGEAAGVRNLGPHGTSALESLRTEAERRGPVRLLASVGACFGRQLFGVRDEVRDTPASANDLLKEAAHHQVIVLLAHGEADTPEDAAFLCLESTGQLDRLDVPKLALAPDAFAGATVILLSCESGRMGQGLAEPGGLAGTLLAAGARCVVAPLWPVRIDVAAQVGRAVLAGLASGDEPWAVLAKLHSSADGEGPSLGRPPPPLSERRATETVQRLSFVAWVG